MLIFPAFHSMRACRVTFLIISLLSSPSASLVPSGMASLLSFLLGNRVLLTCCPRAVHVVSAAAVVCSLLSSACSVSKESWTCKNNKRIRGNFMRHSPALQVTVSASTATDCLKVGHPEDQHTVKKQARVQSRSNYFRQTQIAQVILYFPDNTNKIDI